MCRISVYTRDGEVGSSSYYRIIQYFNRDVFKGAKIRKFVPQWLTKAQYNTTAKGVKGIVVRLLYHLCVFFLSIIFFSVDIVRRPDCIVVLRGIEPKTCFFPVTLLYKKMLSMCKNVIWDFDDDIFLNNEISEYERRLLENYSKKIVVTHKDLANLLPEELKEKVLLMPTTDGDFTSLDIDKINSERMISFSREIRLVWLTSSAGLKDIPKIEEALEEAAICLEKSCQKKLKLIVVCNQPYTRKFEHLVVENIIWTRYKGIQEVIKGHIGIMPLVDTQFARGKGGFKIIQYMAVGLPTIASKVGFNKEIIEDRKTGYLLDDNDTQEQWIDAIVEIASSRERWMMMSNCAMSKWKNDFSYEVNLERWKKLVKGEYHSEEDVKWLLQR